MKIHKFGQKKMVQGHLLFGKEATATGNQLWCALEASEVKLQSVSSVINPDDFINPYKEVIQACVCLSFQLDLNSVD